MHDQKRLWHSKQILKGWMEMPSADVAGDDAAHVTGDAAADVAGDAATDVAGDASDDP